LQIGSGDVKVKHEGEGTESSSAAAPF
jgi:hypothetical protein